MNIKLKNVLYKRSKEYLTIYLIIIVLVKRNVTLKIETLQTQLVISHHQPSTICLGCNNGCIIPADTDTHRNLNTVFFQ